MQHPSYAKCNPSAARLLADGDSCCRRPTQVPVRHAHSLRRRVLHACSHHDKNTLVLCFVAQHAGPKRIKGKLSPKTARKQVIPAWHERENERAYVFRACACCRDRGGYMFAPGTRYRGKKGRTRKCAQLSITRICLLSRGGASNKQTRERCESSGIARDLRPDLEKSEEWVVKQRRTQKKTTRQQTLWCRRYLGEDKSDKTRAPTRGDTISGLEGGVSTNVRLQNACGAHAHGAR